MEWGLLVIVSIWHLLISSWTFERYLHLVSVILRSSLVFDTLTAEMLDVKWKLCSYIIFYLLPWKYVTCPGNNKGSYRIAILAHSRRTLAWRFSGLHWCSYQVEGKSIKWVVVYSLYKHANFWYSLASPFSTNQVFCLNGMPKVPWVTGTPLFITDFWKKLFQLSGM